MSDEIISIEQCHVAEPRRCPFCGGEGHLKSMLAKIKESKYLFYFVECNECGCRTKTFLECYPRKSDQAKKDAERAWNRRA
ncbi:MAG: Lar family restriction alleviation protein [Oscillospiraceae bacterium]|nr:Lar family restriction alleviation protein [Oscillospiraceae bacterium]